MPARLELPLQILLPLALLLLLLLAAHPFGKGGVGGRLPCPPLACFSSRSTSLEAVLALVSHRPLHSRDAQQRGQLSAPQGLRASRMLVEDAPPTSKSPRDT